MSILKIINNLFPVQPVIEPEPEPAHEWKYGEWFLIANDDRTRVLRFKYIAQLQNNRTVVEDIYGGRHMIPDAVLNRWFAGRVVAS